MILEEIKNQYDRTNKFFIDQNYGKGEILLFERDGDFYDHSTQNLLIATFHNEDYAYKVCDLLNEKS